MTEYKRYAIYYAPRPGDFATRADLWLSDAAPHLPGLPQPPAELTVAPRRYGFHGTIKAPFRLADGVTEQDLRDDLAALAAHDASAAEMYAVLTQRILDGKEMTPDARERVRLALAPYVRRSES